MQKKSKKQRWREYQAQKTTKQTKPKPKVKEEVSLYKPAKTKQDLQEIARSDKSDKEKLIAAIIVLNSQKVREGDIVVIDERENVLYYSKMLNMEEFKKLAYPPGYKYQFSKEPIITCTLKGHEKSFVLKCA